MDEYSSKSGFITFLKRLLLISVIVVASILVCYSCSAIDRVSSYTINLNDCIGYIYESENQDTVLIINSVEQAYFNTTDETLIAVYDIEQKENVLILTYEEKDKTNKLVFLSLSENELFWQQKNIILYRWEDLR